MLLWPDSLDEVREHNKLFCEWLDRTLKDYVEHYKKQEKVEPEVKSKLDGGSV